MTPTQPEDLAWLVVVNYGSHRLLEEGLRHFTARYGVVVVDNYHSDEERSATRRLCEANSWVFVGRQNDGFGAACNAGVRAAERAGASSVVLLNPDARLEPAVLVALSEQLHDDPMVLVCPVLRTSEGKLHFQGSQVRRRDGGMRSRTWSTEAAPALLGEGADQDWLTGACLGFSVRLWRLVGGLNEHYFLYWEDVDFSRRCAGVGARLCLRRDLLALHDEGGTHGDRGARARSSLYYYYNCRNRLVYGAAHLSRRELLRWVWTTPQQSWQILLRGGRRQLIESPLPLKAAVLGSLAGFLFVLPVLLGGAAPSPPRSGSLPKSAIT